ncbi:MAG: NAD-dependent isocitrate dehydrogenase [Acidobacteria bacterium]|nr:MAG: NAD-dependent isocitrate dehydrogenase [Acidobacteriota bacterium]
MPHVVTLIPGDGIGPEVTAAVVRIFKVAGVPIEWEPHDAGVIAFKRYGQSLPVELLDSVKRNKVALKGPVTTPIAEGFTSVNVALRKALDLYANLRPVRNLAGVKSRFENVNLIIVRENTEDLYAGLEHEIVPGVVESLKIIIEKASTRIAKFAFGYARAFGRTRVTAIHKANIMKLSDGHAACMQLVMNPEKFDVLLLPNLYGDIVSDLCAGLVGGLGVVPGANLGTDAAVFEAVHGSAPDIANKNLANPTALLLSGLMLLDHIGERQRAERIRTALHRVLAYGRVRTKDLGGGATTTEFTEAVCREVEQ